MANTILSHHQLLDPVEYLYIHLAKGQRFDGRSLEEFRPLSLQTNLISSAHGSALVRVGSTVVVVALKGEIVDERTSFNEKAKLEKGQVCVNIESHSQSDKSIMQDLIKSKSILQNLMNHGSIIDLKSLCIDDNLNIYWRLFVDINVLNCDGISLDACLLGVVAALRSGKLPIVSLVDVKDDEDQIIDKDDDQSILLKKPSSETGKKISICKKTKSIPCQLENIPIAGEFLILNERDFDACIDPENRDEKENQKMSDSYFVICDPSDREVVLFPDNSLSIVVKFTLCESTDDPTILSVHKQAGTTCLSDKVLNQCLKLLVKRKREIFNILNDLAQR